MVKFKLVERTDKFIKYEYYPEADKSKKPGIIILDLINEIIDVEVPAEDDYEEKITIESMNEIRESINEVRRKEGLPDLTAEELSHQIQDKTFYYYADFAIRKISEAYNEGEILESGGAYWY